MPNQSFPLAWPAGVPRTAPGRRGRPLFKPHTVMQAVSNIRREAGLLLGVTGLVISTNIPLKMNGDPYSDPGKMNDSGAAIYFHLDGIPYCLPCDSWELVEQNLWAVSKHIEAMRGMRRWGVGTSQQAFAGYKALAASNEENWWDVLECRPDASLLMIRAQYLARAKSAHPDTGGSEAAMSRLNQARDRALEERAVHA